MNKNSKIHFEVSERKVLLKVFDVVFVLVALYSIGHLLHLQYLEATTEHYYYALAIALYVSSIGTVFEMYDLQVASNQFQVLRSTILTASLTVLFYLLTPIFSAELPTNRFHITLCFGFLENFLCKISSLQSICAKCAACVQSRAIGRINFSS
jgi:hypothetical protein